MKKRCITILMVLFFAFLLQSTSANDEERHDNGSQISYWNDIVSNGEHNLSASSNALSKIYIVVAVVGLLANTVVFFVIFCGDEIGEWLW